VADETGSHFRRYFRVRRGGEAERCKNAAVGKIWPPEGKNAFAAAKPRASSDEIRGKRGWQRESLLERI
jgi:hypothetical protein